MEYVKETFFHLIPRSVFFDKDISTVSRNTSLLFFKLMRVQNKSFIVLIVITICLMSVQTYSVVAAKAAYVPPFVMKIFYTSRFYVGFPWKTR